MFERWIASNLPDAENARRARLLNILALWLWVSLALFLVAALLIWCGDGAVIGGALAVLVLAMIVIVGLVYALNQAGRFRWAVTILTLVLGAAIVVLLLMFGHRSAAPMFIPVFVLAVAVFVQPRAAMTFAVALEVLYLAVVLSEISGRFRPVLLVGDRSFPVELLVIGQLAGLGVIAVLARLASGSLFDALVSARRNLARARQREDELAEVGVHLDQLVSERTRDLERALEDVRQGADRQRALLDALHQQAIPVVPLLGRIVAVPVIGVLDAERAELLLSSVLDGVQRYDARFVLLDVTGVPMLDHMAAHALVQVVAGVRMVGAECVLVGVNPEIASRLVDLNVDLGDMVSRMDMEAGLQYALRCLHYRLERAPS